MWPVVADVDVGDIWVYPGYSFSLVLWSSDPQELRAEC